jgi:hypothetical protein
MVSPPKREQDRIYYVPWFNIYSTTIIAYETLKCYLQLCWHSFSLDSNTSGTDTLYA